MNNLDLQPSKAECLGLPSLRMLYHSMLAGAARHFLHARNQQVTWSVALVHSLFDRPGVCGDVPAETSNITGREYRDTHKLAI